MDTTNALWQRVKQHTLARISKNALVLLIAQGGSRLLNLLLVAQLAKNRTAIL